MELAVDQGPGEALVGQVLEEGVVGALAAVDDGSEDLEAGALLQLHDAVDDLLRGLARDRRAVVGAVRHADAGEEQAQVVVDLGDGADRGAGVAAGRFLVDGDGRRQALDEVDVGLVHLAEELAGVGGQRLDVAALALGVDGVEGQRALTRPRQTGEDNELVAGQLEVDALEVVFACSLHHQRVGHVERLAARTLPAGEHAFGSVRRYVPPATTTGHRRRTLDDRLTSPGVRSRERPDPGLGPAPIVIGCLALLGALLFVVARVLAHDGDVTSLIRIGQETVGDAVVPSDLATVGGLGYDGQYYYRQSLDPLSLDGRVDGIPLDRPAYRSARIGYPTVVWVVSLGGRRSLVPWAMPIVNVLSVAAIGMLGAALARCLGHPSWWGLGFAVWPGFIVGLAYDLAEPLEAALVLGGLLLLRRDRPWIAAAVISAAVVTRESSIVIPMAVLASAAVGVAEVALARLGWFRRWTRLDRDRVGIHVVAGIAPIVTYLGVQTWMTHRWGEAAGASVQKSADHVASVPFLHLARQLLDWLTSTDVVGWYECIQVALILFLFAAFLAAVRSAGGATTVERLGFLGATVLVSTVEGWDRMVVFLRWPDVAMMLGIIVYLGSGPKGTPTWANARGVLTALGVLAGSVVPIWIFI